MKKWLKWIDLVLTGDTSVARPYNRVNAKTSHRISRCLHLYFVIFTLVELLDLLPYVFCIGMENR